MWVLADEDELPERFTDPRLGDFRYVCSNGFEGTVTIGSAMQHKPARWPQCFPDGADGDACCTTVLVRIQTSPEAGR